MTTDNTAASAPQPWTDKQLKFKAFEIATAYFMQPPPKEHPLTKLIMEAMIAMRDELLAQPDDRAALVAQVEWLQKTLNEIMGYGTPYLDSFTEKELERYAQLSPPEMFRLLLNREAANAQLQQQLAAGDAWETCTIDTKPNFITNAQFRGIVATDCRLQRRKEQEAQRGE